MHLNIYTYTCDEIEYILYVSVSIGLKIRRMTLMWERGFIRKDSG